MQYYNSDLCATIEEEYLEKLSTALRNKTYSDLEYHDLCIISEHFILPMETIIDLKDKLVWRLFSLWNRSITLEVLKLFEDKIDWESFWGYNHMITFEILVKFRKKISWPVLIVNNFFNQDWYFLFYHEIQESDLTRTTKSYLEFKYGV